MTNTSETPPVPSRDDCERIDMTRDVDVAYWCRFFDVSHHRLRHAVQQVGPRAPAVLRYLRDHPEPSR
jgi:hypothetical protein